MLHRLSQPGRLRHVVQLHLSRDCNHPDLARQSAGSVVAEAGAIEVHTASQYVPGPDLANEHAVEMAVTRLRTALGDARLVQTVVKRGYRLAYDPERYDTERRPDGCLDRN